MGHISIVYGHISGAFWSSGEDYHKLQQLNKEILNSLPETDFFPWIHRGMFNCPDPKNAEGTYRDQVITFGASYKAVEYEWDEKFESLLKTLYWSRVIIHLETELVGTHTYEWYINDISQMDNWNMNPPQPISSWEFNGGPRKFFKQNN